MQRSIAYRVSTRLSIAASVAVLFGVLGAGSSATAESKAANSGKKQSRFLERPGQQLGNGAFGRISAKARAGKTAAGSNKFGGSRQILNQLKKKLQVAMKPQSNSASQGDQIPVDDVDVKPCPHGNVDPIDTTDDPINGPIDEMDPGTEADSDSLPDESGQIEEENPIDSPHDIDISSEDELPVISSGSELTLNGKSLGKAKGFARLQVTGMRLPVDVLGWNDNRVRIRLPKFDVTQPANATLEVVRADGKVASSSRVKLTPSGAAKLAIRKQR